MKIHVPKGASWWSISKLFQVPLFLLRDSNRNVNPNKLKAGEEIQIPGFIGVPYTIQRGDTLWKLAAANNLSIDILRIINQQMNHEQIFEGETITLPQKITGPCFGTNMPCDFKKLTSVIDSWKHVYPFISVTSIGNSILGKPIQEIRVGNGTKKVHINASFHANEWITTLILMSLLNSYLLSLLNGVPFSKSISQEWYKKVELSIVPMVNPDGVDLVLNGPSSGVEDEIFKINGEKKDFFHWKANIRGVDLNKQFPANWEIDKKRKAPKSASPRDYPGEAPLTEPETIAMADLARNRRFDCVLAFHTQGEEFYWGYEGYEPIESEKIAKEFERKSGYKAIRYIDSHGGFKDWFIQEFKRPGFTIEFGKGINPLPLTQFQDIIKKAEKLFFAALSI